MLAWIAPVLSLCLTAGLTLAQPKADPPAPPTPSAPASPANLPKQPLGHVTFFQAFHTKGGNDLIGTGFFAKTPKGTVIGVTSIHFLDLDGPPVQKVEWLDDDINPIASADRAFGTPGTQPDDSKRDWSADYLLLEPAKPPANTTALELAATLPRAGKADREGPNKGELVWFPFEDRWVTGQVWSASAKTIKVVLDQPLELQGTSGSPVISQESGKVIGVLSAGARGTEKSTIQLAPAPAILKAIEKAEASTDRPKLAEIDWKKHKAGTTPAPAKK